METLNQYWEVLFNFFNLNPHLLILAIVIAVLTSTAMCFFYYKSKQPAHYALIPVWNMIVFLRIVGRPAWHFIFFLIPGYNIIFSIMLFVELNRSYGKTGFFRNLMAVLFNGLYIMYLGFSNEEYISPAYGRKELN